MYLNTLPVTAENILALLLNNLEKAYSIREISLAIGQDYKIVFSTIKELANVQIIEIKRVSNINQCKLNLTKENAALFSFISKRLAAKKLPKRIWNALKDITKYIKNPFYILLAFGSYAKGTATSTSDIDLIFITQNQEQEIEAAARKAGTLNNLKISPIILTTDEFMQGIKEESVAKEAYKKHFIIHGGESFYSLLSQHD